MGITPHKISVDEFIALFDKTDVSDKIVVNIRGSNGSGKSTLCKAFFATDERSFYLVDGKKIVATVFPSYGYLALGKYTKITNGGCDTLKGFDYVVDLLMKLWMIPMNIIFEGIIVTSSHVKYNKFLEELKKNGSPRKELIINLLPPLEVCFKRIYDRNGGKEFGISSVKGKYQQTLCSSRDSHKIYGLNSVDYDNQYDHPKDVINKMLNIIQENTK